MSWSSEIFVGCAPSLEILADDIRNLLNIPLKRVSDDRGIRYTYCAADFEFQLYGDHGMENDRDMNFEDYSYQITFWRLKTADPEQAQSRVLKAAWLAFSKLKETNRYSLMLVENLQHKLASYSPNHD